MPAIEVKGMHCEHCRKSVGEAVGKLPGVASVEVDLAKGLVSWTDADAAKPASVDTVKKAVTDLGFETP